MSEGTYDVGAVIQALYQSPIFGTTVQKLSVGTQSTVLLPFNARRAFCTIYNSGSVLYVKLGTGASLDDYSFPLDVGQTVTIDKDGGVISAIRSSTTDDVRVTEIF